MTDNELRALRDANRDDDMLTHFVNRLIRCRRNLTRISDPDRRRIVQVTIESLQEAVAKWRRDHLTVVS